MTSARSSSFCGPTAVTSPPAGTEYVEALITVRKLDTTTDDLLAAVE